jgi:hypothetical protein
MRYTYEIRLSIVCMRSTQAKLTLNGNLGSCRSTIELRPQSQLYRFFAPQFYYGYARAENFVVGLAVPSGVEPPALGLGNRCSIRLSYGTVPEKQGFVNPSSLLGSVQALKFECGSERRPQASWEDVCAANLFNNLRGFWHSFGTPVAMQIYEQGRSQTVGLTSHAKQTSTMSMLRNRDQGAIRSKN